MRRKQFELGLTGDQAFGTVQQVDNMGLLAGDAAHPYTGSPMQLHMIDFGCADLKASSQFGDHRADQRPLLLQRMDVAEQQVEFDPADPHLLIVTTLPGIRSDAGRDRRPRRCGPARAGFRRSRSVR